MYCNDTKYGLVWDSSKQHIIDEYYKNEKLLNFFKMYKHEYKIKKALSSDEKNFTTINVNPVGTYCEGSCPYCYNNEHKLLEKSLLDLEEYDSFLKKVKPHMKTEIPLIRFTGGSCGTNPFLLEYVKKTKEHFDKFDLRFLVDFLWSEKTYDVFVEFCKQLLTLDYVRDIFIYTTTDFGNTTRHSKRNNVTEEILEKRADRFYDIFKDTKIKIEYRINISNTTNLNKCEEEVKKRLDWKIQLVYSPVRDKLLQPTIMQMSIFNKKMEDLTELCAYTHCTGEYVLSTDYVNGLMAQSNKYNFPFLQLEDGILLYHVDNGDCFAYNTLTGISSEGYAPCIINYLTDSQEDNWFKLTNKQPLYNNFITMYPDCLDCELIGVCNECNIRRYIYPCNQYPVLKYWQEHMWQSKMKQEHLWEIL